MAQMTFVPLIRAALFFCKNASLTIDIRGGK
nr:MAG TPA: hypothetical protein [Caudoviricetes sp.]